MAQDGQDLPGMRRKALLGSMQDAPDTGVDGGTAVAQAPSNGRGDTGGGALPQSAVASGAGMGLPASPGTVDPSALPIDRPTPAAQPAGPLMPPMPAPSPGQPIDLPPDGAAMPQMPTTGGIDPMTGRITDLLRQMQPGVDPSPQMIQQILMNLQRSGQ